MKKYLTISQRIKKLKASIKDMPEGILKEDYKKQLLQAQEQEKRETFNFKAQKQNTEQESQKLSIREQPSHENTDTQAITPPEIPRIENQQEIESRILNLFSGGLR